MNIIRKLYLRLVKNIEIYKISNITLGLGSMLSNGSILNAKFGKIILGKDIRIGNSSELVAAKNKTIQVKDYSTLYSNCKILGQITIERYCVLATNIYMSSGNHFAFEHPELLIRIQDQLVREKRNDINNPIHIHEDVWIGNGVFISQGITIGRGAVIGAGTIVTKNIKPYDVVVGNPGKVIKNRLKFDPPNQLHANKQNNWPYFYQGFDHRNGYHNKSDNGLRLIDIGIIYLSKDVKALSIFGFTDVSCNMSIEVNNTLVNHKLLKGKFQIDMIIKNNPNLEHLILKLIPDSISHKNIIYIHSVIDKTKENE